MSSSHLYFCSRTTKKNIPSLFLTMTSYLGGPTRINFHVFTNNTIEQHSVVTSTIPRHPCALDIVLRGLALSKVRLR